MFGLEDKFVFYLIIFYGYGDYYGGFNVVVKCYNFCIVMSELEWELLEYDSFVSWCWGVKLKKDMVVNDGDIFNIDGIMFIFYVMFGYMSGILLLVFFVYDGDEFYCVVLWGGMGFNYGLDV